VKVSVVVAAVVDRRLVLLHVVVAAVLLPQATAGVLFDVTVATAAAAVRCMCFSVLPEHRGCW
jgi:hypothetical protein